ncbi:MAG: hypothetical protein ACHQIO_05045 [Nevskiales bacterium]
MALSGRYDAAGVEVEFEPGSRRRVLRNLLGIKSVREMQQVESEALYAATQNLIDDTRVDHRSRGRKERLELALRAAGPGLFGLAHDSCLVLEGGTNALDGRRARHRFENQSLARTGVADMTIGTGQSVTHGSQRNSKRLFVTSGTTMPKQLFVMFFYLLFPPMRIDASYRVCGS